MALNKSNLAINFSEGLDTKTDPFQIKPGKMLNLSNTIFSTGGLLQKRNGYLQLTSLPDTSSTFLTTFKNDLLAIGDNLQAYSTNVNNWFNKGNIQPVKLNTLSLIRSATNQSYVDTAISSSNLICTVYIDEIPSGGSIVNTYKFAVADVTTGQNIISPTILTPISGSVVGGPKVFFLGKYFIIVFSTNNGGTQGLQYVAINSVTMEVLTAVSISSSYVANNRGAFDGLVTNNNLYLAWNGGDLGGAIRMTFIDSALNAHSTKIFAGKTATILGINVDNSNGLPILYVGFYNSGDSTGWVFAVNQQLNSVLAFTQVINALSIDNITIVADNNVATVIYEVDHNYSYDSAIPTHFIQSRTVTSLGSVGSIHTVKRSVGLASKAFYLNNIIYFLSAYQSSTQPTYFLLDISGNILAKLAYSNGGGYVNLGLTSPSINGSVVSIGYLIKDFISGVNKIQGASNSNPVYSQTGINLVEFDVSTLDINTTEIGNDLHISGGFVWMYDGYLPVEHLFHLWPDNIESTPATTGGALKSQQYFYQVTYEWSDNQGNIFRSAPSIPLSANITAASPTPISFTSVFTSGVSSITVSSTTGLFIGQVLTDSTTGANIQAGTYITSIVGSVIGLSLPTGGSSAMSPGDTIQTVQTNSITLNIPTLRLTAKIASPVKIVVYRWSTDQQTYYQVTSLTIPTLNDITTDSIQFVDTLSDHAILGNNIIYTTGGVIENIAAPSPLVMTLYKSRIFLVDSEDKNLLWYSKQVIEGTPAEFSDLFTLFIAPTTGAQGDTGSIMALSALDDKLIIFKKDAIYYTTGNGPDNTGANNDFSEPVFISSTVGCSNQDSIVFTPNGLMFQSDKGIWLLSRDLSTRYIGAAVEKYNSDVVLSALTIPGTNQVRFTLNNGVTLMYDYYYDQWGTFTGIPGISSTLYNSRHTFINSRGQVFTENPGFYLDGSSPVLMSFTTGWINLAGLQGFERAYYFYLLGSYISPHKLQIEIAYDYASSPSQNMILTPDNYNPAYGSDPLYGSSSPYGGNPPLEQWRVFFQQQKCQAFQITINEIYDFSFGIMAGAGLTISGLDMIVGLKGNYPRIKPSRSIG